MAGKDGAHYGQVVPVLEENGAQTVDFYKIDDETYYLDFSPVK